MESKESSGEFLFAAFAWKAVLVNKTWLEPTSMPSVLGIDTAFSLLRRFLESISNNSPFLVLVAQLMLEFCNHLRLGAEDFWFASPVYMSYRITKPLVRRSS